MSKQPSPASAQAPAIIPPLTNVHDALQRALVHDRDKVTMAPVNFKSHPIMKAAAEEICARAGTTLSGFLRECINGLVRDFHGEKTAAKLENSI
jgi:hypothetical protein